MQHMMAVLVARALEEHDKGKSPRDVSNGQFNIKDNAKFDSEKQEKMTTTKPRN